MAVIYISDISGYFGKRCNSFMPCASNPCYNGGTCGDLDMINYECACKEYYAGKRCQLPTPCAHVECKNGGTCVNIDDTDYKCDCPPGDIF